MNKKNKKTLTTESSGQELEQAVRGLCARVPVSAGMPTLVRELAQLLPQLFFREALTRNGWYRLGGIVDGGGQRIAENLGQWVEAQLASRRKSLRKLVSDFATSGYRATRLIGKTHYLVASTGNYATNFMQIELEELREVVAHELFAAGTPGSLEDLLDPPHQDAGEALLAPLCAPLYKLRRITNVAALLEQLATGKVEPSNVHRFFEAWQSSSAGLSSEFSNHWVLAVRENLDRERNPVLQATPVAAIRGALPRFECSFGACGLALYDALQGFDRQIGYPMAWFFHMLTTRAVPHAAASAVVEDVQAGFSYLPARDVKVIKDWLHRPFSF